MYDKKWLVVLFLLSSVYAQDMLNEYGLVFWPFGENALGFLFWLVFWLALVVVVYLMIKSTQVLKKEPALEIIKRRYASGEISRNEFKKIKKEISK